MKGITKLFAVAVAGIALASCSDELNVDQKTTFKNTNADLVGRLEASPLTRIAQDESAGYLNAKSVWSDDDKVKVFSLVGALTYDEYEVNQIDPSDPQVAYFDKTNEPSALGDEKYAVTESQMVYAISATSDGKPRLTVTIPEEYTASHEGKVYNFPVPYWGKVNTYEQQSDGTTKLDVDFKATTGALRVDVNTLPAGTKAILLTTHGSRNLKEISGFQLAEPAANGGYPQGYEDTNGWWENVKEIVGGYNEALSGTFDAVLDPNNLEALKVNEILVHKDVLKVNLEDPRNINNQIIYIPLIAQTYKNLHVIALTGESANYTYRWFGTELKHYQDFTVQRSFVYDLMANLVNLDEADLNTLNNTIYTESAKGQTNGAQYTTVINVNKLVNNDGVQNNTYFHTDMIEIPSENANNVIVNIKEVDEDNFEYGTEEKKLQIVETKKAYSPNGTRTTNASTIIGSTVPAASQRTVNVNLPEEWSADAEKFVEVLLPTSIVEIGTTGGAESDLNVTVTYAASNNFVSGHNLIDGEGNLKDYKGAAIIVKNGIGTLTVGAKNTGDVYVYTPGQAQAETEIATLLDVQTASPISIRIDDALVKKIKYVDAETTRYVFSTGSTGIQSVVDAGEATPRRVTLQSYWTGKALTENAYAKGYDVETIFTAAQLASIGIDPQKAYKNKNFKYEEDNREEPTAYTISELVNHIWLGAEKYPWVGAEVVRNGFSLDGNSIKGVTLQNMTLGTSVDGEMPLIDDPHFCCTTCNLSAINIPKVKLEKNLGLIRSIINEDEATIKNVNLNDVKLVTTSAIDNVGSIVGLVKTGEAYFKNNNAGDVKISVAGEYIGGIAGKIDLGEDGTTLTIEENTVLDNEESGYIKSTKKGYVGGLVGYAKTKGTTITDSRVELTGNNGEISAAKDYAGGLIGRLEAGATNNKLYRNNVNVENGTIAAQNYVGGNIGYLTSEAVTGIQDNDVKVKDLTASKKYAGGLIGNYKTAATKSVKVHDAGVEVTGTLKAVDGWDGGLVGRADIGILAVGATEPEADGDKARNFAISVEIGKMAGALAVGGIAGDNSATSPVKVYTYETAADEDLSYFTTVDINVKDWENTKDANYFKTDVQTQMAGTISNVLGLMDGDLYIVEDYLTVTENLNSDKKIAVLYRVHPDRQGNDVVGGSDYWGDYNGYVGWSQNGTYTLVNDEVEKNVKKDQSSLQNCNLYMSDYSKSSKLAAAE